jgi:hypothetical protein
MCRSQVGYHPVVCDRPVVTAQPPHTPTLVLTQQLQLLCEDHNWCATCLRPPPIVGVSQDWSNSPARTADRNSDQDAVE